MASETAEIRPRKGYARIRLALWHEFRLVIPPTLFFFVGFNLILLTKRLFLADYLIAYTGCPSSELMGQVADQTKGGSGASGW